MIAIQRAIFSTLSGHAGLSALIGTRVYPDIAPQEVAKPYCVWSEVSLVQANDLNGSAETGGLNNYRIDVTSWSTKASTSRDVDAQVRLAMIAATAFKSVLLDSRSLGFEDDTKLFAMQTDFSVWLKT